MTNSEDISTFLWEPP